MTAQIIIFDRDAAQEFSRRIGTGSLHPKPKRRRGLQLTDKGRALLARLNHGEVITDIGQIDQPTRRLLKRWLDKGWVRRGEDYTFPATKTCWAGCGLWDEDGLALVPLNVIFREA